MLKRAIPVLATLAVGGLLLAGGLGPNPAVGQDEKNIEMADIKIKDLVGKIAAQKGKVVVIDLWGFFCVPCKAEFHNLVRLHHTYGKDGLVCMSLSLDPSVPLKKKGAGIPQGEESRLRQLLARGRHRGGPGAMEIRTDPRGRRLRPRRQARQRLQERRPQQGRLHLQGSGSPGEEAGRTEVKSGDLSFRAPKSRHNATRRSSTHETILAVLLCARHVPPGRLR